MQMSALSELFDQTSIVVPVHRADAPKGAMPIAGHCVVVQPLQILPGHGILRRLCFFVWLCSSLPIIVGALRWADAVHTPIPGDVGTVGMLMAFFMRKPLFVRHCGNWFQQRTTAEKFWRWFMERFAGGRNVFMATGGATKPPSTRNPNIQWIFSTSLTKAELSAYANPKGEKPQGNPRLITVGRQEPSKNTHLVIKSLKIIQRDFPEVRLDVVGNGSELINLHALTNKLGLSECVDFHGHVDHSTVLSLLQNAHIFCFPTASEGFPKAVVEAMACGLPVVTTPVSVLPQLVGNSGITLKTYTASAIADAVANIYQDTVTYRSMSIAATEAAQYFSLENWEATIKHRLSVQWGILRANG
jgi:glycosyltransferase involved in cell wall biosynthesis